MGIRGKEEKANSEQSGGFEKLELTVRVQPL
jgi:hypothetical protein